MSNVNFTQLPTTGAATLTDIIAAVQGGGSGTTVQETLQQVLNLMNANIIVNFAGNPNGNVAGTQYQTLCWNTVSNNLWLCTVSGSAASAVWMQITSANGSFAWNNVTTATQAMLANNGYIVNNNINPCILTLPATIAQGNIIEVTSGTSAGATTAWKIAQNASQQIFYGTSSTTSGVTGYLQATQQYDAVKLLCVTANLTFVVLSSVGNITVN